VVAISNRASGCGSDSDSTLDTDSNDDDDDDGSGGKLGCGDDITLVKNEPNFGTNMYWYNCWPMWVRREFPAGSGGSSERPEESFQPQYLELVSQTDVRYRFQMVSDSETRRILILLLFERSTHVPITFGQTRPLSDRDSWKAYSCLGR